MGRIEGSRVQHRLNIAKAFGVTSELDHDKNDVAALAFWEWYRLFEKGFYARWGELLDILKHAEAHVSALYIQPQVALCDHNTQFANVTVPSGRKYSRISFDGETSASDFVCGLRWNDHGDFKIPAPFYFGFPGRNLHFLLHEKFFNGKADFSDTAEAYESVIVSANQVVVKPISTNYKGDIDMFALGTIEEQGHSKRDTFALYRLWPGFRLNRFGRDMQVYISDHIVGSVLRKNI